MSPAAASCAGADPPPKLKRKGYERELRRPHGELVAMQEGVKASGAKLCVVFEGRDTAGKGGTIKRITERVSPRTFRVVALPAPTERERTQMYIQRYVPHFPAAGEVVILTAAGTTEAGDKRGMACQPEETQRFLELAPSFILSMNPPAGMLSACMWVLKVNGPAAAGLLSTLHTGPKTRPGERRRPPGALARAQRATARRAVGGRLRDGAGQRGACTVKAPAFSQPTRSCANGYRQDSSDARKRPITPPGCRAGLAEQLDEAVGDAEHLRPGVRASGSMSTSASTTSSSTSLWETPTVAISGSVKMLADTTPG